MSRVNVMFINTNIQYQYLYISVFTEKIIFQSWTYLAHHGCGCGVSVSGLHSFDADFLVLLFLTLTKENLHLLFKILTEQHGITGLACSSQFKVAFKGLLFAIVCILHKYNCIVYFIVTLEITKEPNQRMTKK